MPRLGSRVRIPSPAPVFFKKIKKLKSGPSGPFLLRGPPRPADLSRFYASGGKSWGAIEGHRADSRAASLRVKLPDWGLPCPNFVAQPGKAAAGGDEAEYDFVGQRHDEAVAPASQIRRHQRAATGIWEKSDASRMLSARTAREFGYVFSESQRRKLKALYGREIREDRGAEVLRRHAELDRQDHGLDAV